MLSTVENGNGTDKGTEEGNDVNNLTRAPRRTFQVSRDTSPRAGQDEEHELYFNYSRVKESHWLLNPLSH